MLTKTLDRLSPEARTYVDSILTKAGEFQIDLTRGSKNRGGAYNSEDTGIFLSVSNKFPLESLSDASFVLGWVQDVLLLGRLYGCTQISSSVYVGDRNKLLSRMETISASVNGYSTPDLTHLQEKSVPQKESELEAPAFMEPTGTVDIDAIPFAGGNEANGSSGAWEFGPYDTLHLAMDDMIPEKGLFIWKLEDPATKAAEPSPDGSQWVIL